MSDHNSKGSKIPLYPHRITAIQHIILDYIQSNSWHDYQGFSRSLSEYILKNEPTSETNLKKIIERFRHPFFSFNSISRKYFSDGFPYQRIAERITNTPVTESAINITIKEITKKEKTNTALAFSDIFPEIKSIDVRKAEKLLSKLDIPEREIQNALRDALREKGATNITRRESDTPLEIADIEDFSIKIRGESKSIAVVVKGYRTINGKKINFEIIGYQILKAYQSSKPDYVMLVIAKDLVDGVITQLKQYAQSVGKPNLIILCDTLDLARFLYWKKIIN